MVDQRDMHETPIAITARFTPICSQMCEASQGIFEQDVGSPQIWSSQPENSVDP